MSSRFSRQLQADSLDSERLHVSILIELRIVAARSLVDVDDLTTKKGERRRKEESARASQSLPSRSSCKLTPCPRTEEEGRSRFLRC